MLVKGATDVLTCDGARPSATTVLNEEPDMFTAKFPGFSVILYHTYGYGYTIWKSWQDLDKSHNTASVRKNVDN